MAASLINGKRISTTTFDVSEPLEITTQGHKLQGPLSSVQATHNNGGPINHNDGVEPFQKPRASAVQNDSIGLVSSDDIKSIKARARKGRTSSLQPGFVAVRDEDQEKKENLRSFATENTPQYDSSGLASKVRERKVIKTLQKPRVEMVGDNDKETMGSMQSSSTTEHAPDHRKNLSVAGATTPGDDIQLIKNRARQARSSLTQCLPGTVLVEEPLSCSGESVTQEGHPSVSALELSRFSDDIQGMKDRARATRASLIKAPTQPGFVAVQDVQVDALNDKDGNPTPVPRVDNASGRNFRVPRNLRVSYPAGSYISQIRLEKEAAMQGAANAHWIDPLSATSTRLISTREMLPCQGEGAYDMYANNPTFPRNSLTERHNMNHSYKDQPEDDTLNAPVQHQLVWEQGQDNKGVHVPVINRNLCIIGGCVVLVVIVAVSVALGVTLGANKNGNSSAASEGAVQPTESPAAILSSTCMASVDDAGQSDRFLQLSEMLGVSVPNTARRAAICWFADLDGAQIDSTDLSVVEKRFALAVLYFSTMPEGGDHVLTTWLSNGSECEWQGITCENEDVVIVGLSDVALVGTIPPEVSLLSGLSQLLLDGNRLTGTIPDELYQVTSLSILNLERNSLEGSLSRRVGNLTSLKVLGMGENKRMTGSLPDELFGLTGLEEIYILGNNFVGSIPSSIGGMTNLHILAADFNSFNGTLPTEIGLCTSLEELGLSGSDISSTIPTEIGLLRNLTALSLGDKLQGTIPTELGNCANMAQLVLHTNLGLDGTIPSELGNLSKLEKLQLHSTSLTGTMPVAICSLRSKELRVLESDCYGGVVLECAEPACCTLCH